MTHPTSPADAPDLVATLRRDLLGYIASLGPPGLAGVALLPLLTARLSGAQLGVLALIEALMLPAATLGLMGMKFAYLYRYAHEPAQRPALLSTCTALALGCGALCGAALALALHAPPLLRALGVPPELAPRQPLLLAAVLVSGCLLAMTTTQLRAQRRIRAAGVLGHAQLVVVLVVTWLALERWQLGLDGVFLGQLAGHTLAALGSLPLLGRGAWGRVRPRETGALLGYGWPLTAALLVRYGMDTLARVGLAAWVSLEQAGDWLVVARVVLLFEVLLANPFFMAWGGLVHHALRRPDAAPALARVSRATLRWGFAAALLLALLHQPLLWLLAARARAELAPLFVLLLATRLLPMLRSPLCAGLQRTGHTGWAVRNNLWALLVFALLAWPLAATLGAHGLALAMLLAGLASAVPVFRESQRELAQPLNWRDAAWAGAATLGLAAAAGASAAAF